MAAQGGEFVSPGAHGGEFVSPASVVNDRTQSKVTETPSRFRFFMFSPSVIDRFLRVSLIEQDETWLRTTDWLSANQEAIQVSWRREFTLT